MTLPQHSSLTDQHFSPSWLVDACMDAFRNNYLLGNQGVGTLLDPASSPLANTLIQADKIFTKEDDGLTKDWEAITLFCNPPGGKTKNKSNQNLWAGKFCNEYESEHFLQGVFVAFNPELLFRMSKLWGNSKVVMLSKRVHYLSEYANGVLKQGQWSEIKGIDADLDLRLYEWYQAEKTSFNFVVGKSFSAIFLPKFTGMKYPLCVTFGEEYTDAKDFHKWTDAPTHSTALVFKGVTTQNIRRAFVRAGIEHTIVDLAE